MWLVPLNDTTEARYGEMARKMLFTHDWITLWHKIGVPFWGKPPLSIWLTAFSMKLGGLHAFTARLPDFILAIIMLVMIGKLVAKYRGAVMGRISVIVLASSFLFYLIAGTVMMDPALLLAVMICQTTFWRAVHEHSRTMGYLFFLGLALGLLAKGLVVVVLVGGSVGGWTLLKNQWKAVWTRLPWFSGTLLMLAVSLPWYILAERKTPGFLNYFIVGEHFNRFFHSAWQGDKYGFAHAKAFGTVWTYMLLGTLPWSLVLLNIVSRDGKLAVRRVLDQGVKTWNAYWFVCMLFPLVFFTFAKNLIYPYAAPALPGFAILFSEWWVARHVGQPENKRLLVLASVTGFGFLIVMALFCVAPSLVSKSQYRMVTIWQQQPDHQQNPLMYWRVEPHYSAQFYTQGHAAAVFERKCSQFNPSMPVYWVVEAAERERFKRKWPVPMKEVASVRSGTLMEYLIKVQPNACNAK